ncbi:MAG: hypothetical protein R3243_14675 [Arenibacter latericius]|nr:hypothetical protein [Arenibacter latericius]
MINFSEYQLNKLELASENIEQTLALEELGIINLTYSHVKFLFDYFLKKNNWKVFRFIFVNISRKLNNRDKERLYREYLLNHKHFDHEDMIKYFYVDYIDDLKNIKMLVDLINSPPRYFYDQEREYVFIEKCINALKAQKYPESFHAIKKISDTTKDKTVRKMTTYIVENWTNNHI